MIYPKHPGSWEDALYVLEASIEKLGLQEYPRAACVVVENPDGLILSVARKNDPEMFTMPGGKLEAGEDFLACARRELLEETGYEFGDDHWMVFVGLCEKQDVQGYDLCVAYYATEARKVAEQTEKPEVRWSTRDSMESNVWGTYNRSVFKQIQTLKDYLEFYNRVPPP